MLEYVSNIETNIFRDIRSSKWHLFEGSLIFLDFQIIVVNATDEDEIAPNNRFLFSVDQSSEDLFAIDSNSGKISTRAGLDFEQSNSHTISVIVTDLGSPTKSSACALVVTVLDVNDVPPAFDNVSIVQRALWHFIFLTGKVGCKQAVYRQSHIFCMSQYHVLRRCMKSNLI